jgi:hypothetical protein
VPRKEVTLNADPLEVDRRIGGKGVIERIDREVSQNAKKMTRFDSGEL